MLEPSYRSTNQAVNPPIGPNMKNVDWLIRQFSTYDLLKIIDVVSTFVNDVMALANFGEGKLCLVDYKNARIQNFLGKCTPRMVTGPVQKSYEWLRDVADVHAPINGVMLANTRLHV